MRRSGPANSCRKIREGQRLRMPPKTSESQQSLLLLSIVTRNVNQTTKRHRIKIKNDEPLIPTYSVMLLRADTYISHIPTLLLAKSIYFFALLASLCDDEISTIYTVTIILIIKYYYDYSTYYFICFNNLTKFHYSWDRAF